MPDSLQFNPMTIALLRYRQGEVAGVQLRCFAPRRSLKPINIDRADEPELFCAVLAWLEAKRSEAAPALSLEQKLPLWSQGLLITAAERSAMPPEARPELGEGHALAALLCPQVADLLRRSPNLLPLPVAPDRDLAEQGYCIVPPVTAAADIAPLRAFYTALCDGDWLEPGTGKEPGQRGIYNDPVARRIQSDLTPYFCALTGKSVKPSYTYAREYTRGAQLPMHTDRVQCEYTFSLYVDYQPEPQLELCPWPMIIHTTGGEVAVSQPLGGGALLRGRTLPHSRAPLPQGHRAMMLFIHYVDERFTGSLD